MSERFVIVGAGECGARAALALREQGFAGAVTLIGAETYLPYERPPLSKQAMAGLETPLPKTIASTERLTEADISFCGGTWVTAIDRPNKRLVLSGEETLGYDRLLLATGCVPRRLPVPGADAASIAYLRTYDDALAIRSRIEGGAHVAIIGGGFIGLELASSARRRGAEVTLIEALPRLLTRGVPESLARRVEDEHRTHGVRMMFGDGIAELRCDAAGTQVVLTSGNEIAADLIVVGIGAVPVTGPAEAAGLVVENGIAVDEMLRTSDPDIFAAGDCCSYPLPIYGGRRVRLESWRNAQDQGNLVARNMMGTNEAIASVPWFWSDQYELTLQITGLVDEGHETVTRALGDGATIHFHLATDGRLVAASGIGPGNAVAKDIRLAEMLIGRGARPDPTALGDAGVRLKGLLAA
ncbi:NAD(P)/FAD-dependent oxidoreductase [Devosia nitrariae]|uniref:Ferredoxin reductase n=1 Tax=Devosia nitrariae TaxID=2071872 RepID=A0ABQ5W883_9HYPH|nr:FAD-dependent oxidoreductase [Devosia nitrariae]GLQ56304.1 ferredoxin reductase [Devosia nitrariae]